MNQTFSGFQAKYLDPVQRRLFLDKKAQIPQEANPAQEFTQEQILEENATDRDETQKLDEMVQVCEEPLIQIKTVFPFVLFPNEVIVDIIKVSIVYGNFFASKQIHSVLIKDISDIVVETNLFFATLKIIDIGYTDSTIDINYLKKTEGDRVRKVIQGLVMAHRHGVNLTQVDTENLLEKLESLGTDGVNL